MPRLSELQAAFARGLAGDTGDADRWIKAEGVDPAARLRIYRNNVELIFEGYLRAAYPAVERLGGAEYFAGISREYRSAHPSRSGNLHDAGAAFADFLAARLAGTPYVFMADVARLEWAYQEVLVAPAPRVFDAVGFAEVSADAHGRVVFTLAPSVRRVASTYPIAAIWEANRDPGSSADEVDLNAGGDRLLLHQFEGLAHVRRLDAPTDAFVCALVGRACLADAMAALEAVDAAVDPSPLLYEFIRTGRIDGFYLD
jgi:hypothetical protein